MISLTYLQFCKNATKIQDLPFDTKNATFPDLEVKKKTRILDEL